jgi:hypothetical protein
MPMPRIKAGSTAAALPILEKPVSGLIGKSACAASGVLTFVCTGNLANSGERPLTPEI